MQQSRAEPLPRDISFGLMVSTMSMDGLFPQASEDSRSKMPVQVQVVIYTRRALYVCIKS